MNKLTVVNNDFYTAIDRSELSDTTKKQYCRAIKRAIKSGVNLTDYDSVADYSTTLKTSNKSFLKAALRLTLSEIENKSKGSATPDNVNAVQATVYRIESLNNAIKVNKPEGQKTFTWLTRSQVIQLFKACENERDKIAIGLLVAAGLRRNEAVNLKCSDIVKQNDRWVLSAIGKGDKPRTVPISQDFANLLNQWCDKLNGGYVLRSLGMNKQLGDRLSNSQLYNIVRRYGMIIGIPELQPHDLRRSFARIAYDNNVPIKQISLLLGHSNIEVTERYLGIEIDLNSTASDFVPVV